MKLIRKKRNSPQSEHHSANYGQATLFDAEGGKAGGDEETNEAEKPKWMTPELSNLKVSMETALGQAKDAGVSVGLGGVRR